MKGRTTARYGLPGWQPSYPIVFAVEYLYFHSEQWNRCWCLYSCYHGLCCPASGLYHSLSSLKYHWKLNRCLMSDFRSYRPLLLKLMRLLIIKSAFSYLINCYSKNPLPDQKVLFSDAKLIKRVLTTGLVKYLSH